MDMGKGRTIRKLMVGRGGGGGRLNEKKINARQLTLKKIHANA